MNEDKIVLAVSDVIDGREWTARMPYLRELWEDVDEHDREQLRLIVRYRFGGWVRKETGIRLPMERLDALPVVIF